MEPDLDPPAPTEGDVAATYAATGAVTLAGGTVLLRPEPGTYGGRKYTIISADGGVTGRFDALDAPVFAFLDSSLDYTAQTVDFILKPTRTIDSIGETPNQAATPAAISRPSASQRAVFDRKAAASANRPRPSSSAACCSAMLSISGLHVTMFAWLFGLLLDRRRFLLGLFELGTKAVCQLRMIKTLQGFGFGFQTILA